MWYRDFYPRFPRSKPRQAKGGIKAQTKRGSFGKSWWAQRWIAVLESFDIGARLGRGRTYARQGQVLSIDVAKGKVTAKVQGSMATPYKIEIEIAVLPAAAWKKLAAELSRQAIFLAKLLAGEMPQDVEQAFKDAGLSLFPEKLRDLSTECSCPDDSNPCKHIAAVYYLLGEEFDRDPFLLFRLRGLDREELMGMLSPAAAAAGTEPEAPAAAPEPLSADAHLFWEGAEEVEGKEAFGEVQTPPVAAALPKRLGNFPFWRGQEPLLDAVTAVYRAASTEGLSVFLGEKRSGGGAAG